MTDPRDLISAKNPHDRFIRGAFDNQHLVLDFLETYLPAELREACDLAAYEPIKQSFVSTELQESITDLLFRIPYRADEGCVYVYTLVEHQRSNDPMMAFRDLQYKVRISEFHMQNTGRQEMPLILSWVIYNGRESFTAPQKVSELVAGPEPWSKLMLNGYQLINLPEIDDDQLKNNVFMGVVFLMLKHIDKPEIVAKLKNLAYHMIRIHESATGWDFLKLVLAYVVRASQETSIEAIATILGQAVSEKAAEEIMTLGDILEAKGHKKGHEEGHRLGRQEGLHLGRKEQAIATAKKMLAKGMDVQSISLFTNLSLREIEVLRHKD